MGFWVLWQPLIALRANSCNCWDLSRIHLGVMLRITMKPW